MTGVPASLDGRTSRSILRPGIDPPPGSAVCLCCPWARIDLADPGPVARTHHEESGGHPVVAVPAEQKEIAP